MFENRRPYGSLPVKASQNLSGIPPSVFSQLESSPTDKELKEVGIAGGEGLRQLLSMSSLSARAFGSYHAEVTCE